MSTLDTNGMVSGYKVNRSLNPHEQRHRFDIRQPASPRPHYDLSLIKLNGTFVECVDKWYAMRGFVAMGGCNSINVCSRTSARDWRPTD